MVPTTNPSTRAVRQRRTRTSIRRGLHWCAGRRLGFSLAAADTSQVWLYGCIPSWQSFSQLLLGAPRQPFVIPPAMQERVDHFKGVAPV